MRKLFAFLIGCCCVILHAQQKEIPLLKYEELEAKINNENAELLVLNFWATTCAPCVKELPDFMEVNKTYKDHPKFKMLLVSLDRAKDLERVIKFIQTKNITAEVVLLDDIKRMNLWIPKFDKDWQGEIPVTVFYKNKEKVKFHDGEMSKEELSKTVSELLN